MSKITNFYRLNEIVLKAQGHATRFLNGLTSNTLQAPRNAFLNQHGRIIATCFQQQIAEDEFLLSVPESALEPLLKHLERYAKLNHTQLQPIDHKAYMDMDSVKILFSPQEIPTEISQEAFTLFRLDHRMPFMGEDYSADEFILNIDEGDFVSYTKGCYLGQEPVSKVYNRSKPARKLMVKFEDECSPEEKGRMSSQVLDPRTGRLKGFIFVKNT